jgi:hypothetical protein
VKQQAYACAVAWLNTRQEPPRRWQGNWMDRTTSIFLVKGMGSNGVKALYRINVYLKKPLTINEAHDKAVNRVIQEHVDWFKRHDPSRIKDSSITSGS